MTCTGGKAPAELHCMLLPVSLCKSPKSFCFEPVLEGPFRAGSKQEAFHILHRQEVGSQCSAAGRCCTLLLRALM